MSHYKILFDLTQSGWTMGKQQPQSSLLKYGNDRLVILWATTEYVYHSAHHMHNRHKSGRYKAVLLLKSYGFKESQMPIFSPFRPVRK